MKYNWKSTGPGGCDTHCIESPCGPCITGSPTLEHAYEALTSIVAKQKARLYRLENELEEANQEINDLSESLYTSNEAALALTHRLEELLHDENMDFAHKDSEWGNE